jgi:hypothetical protein
LPAQLGGHRIDHREVFDDSLAYFLTHVIGVRYLLSGPDPEFPQRSQHKYTVLFSQIVVSREIPQCVLNSYAMVRWRRP